MTIQEAIRQAGEGGGIKRPFFAKGAYVKINSNGRYMEYIWSTGKEEKWYVAARDILADDWEVITSEIGVGDTVEVSSPNKICTRGCKISSMGCGTVTLFTTNLEACACKESIRFLTLIRKGPKVLTFKDVKGKYIDVVKGAHSSDVHINLDNSKCYTLTLTEEKE